MERFKKIITALLIDILMGTIRVSIFSVFIYCTNIFGLLGSIVISFLINLIYTGADKFIFKIGESGRLSDPFYKRVKFRVTLRCFLIPIIGLVAGFGFKGILNMFSILETSQNNLTIDVLFYSIIIFFSLLDLIYVLTKYWLYKSKIELLSNYKYYVGMFNNKYLPTVERERFLEIVETLNTNDEKFNATRSMLEVILKRFNETDLGLLPDNLFNKRGAPILALSISYLGGKVTNDESASTPITVRRVPDHIFYSMSFIKETTSAFSHSYSHKNAPHLNKACIMALLECMNHLKEMVDDRK
jgi:hypothetical protein